MKKTETKYRKTLHVITLFLYLITSKGLILPKPVLQMSQVFPTYLFTVTKRKTEQSSPALTVPIIYKVKEDTLHLQQQTKSLIFLSLNKISQNIL